MDADDDGDSISRISLKPDTLFGRHCDFPKLDKMCGMVIRIRNNSDVAESRNRLIAMLEDVLSPEDSDVKKRKLEEKYAMKMTLELEGRVKRMCNLSDVVVERGIELGQGSAPPCPTKSILPENIPGIYFSLDVIEA